MFSTQKVLPTSCTGLRAAALVLTALVCSAAPAVAEEAKFTTSSFTASGRPVQVEQFAPQAEGKQPAVILLHGSGGLPERDHRVYRHVARAFARAGYVALLVHYFDSTGTEQIEPAQIDKKLFLAWKDAVHGALRHAATLPGVDPKRIGLVGFSLGACLSLAAAGEAETRVAAVVELFGCLPEEFGDNARRMPPTLIVHGSADSVVPVDKARRLEKLLREHRRTCEVKIYEGQEHVFGGRVLSPDVIDAQKRTLDFLARHLKSAEVARVP
jgi:carboxymethylenebutenolidase